ncbi:hypothetical protein EHS25_007273 [Saitozyma podzolica]|uniref:Uncharacterized protein n=1 Tax=Saitozyma podzolica TaxID=1890683 RepID=A0A427XMX9_9TREE|nr:hypothetical protein EHS25_007273 [Saitozyma podzolica]
MRTPRYTVFIVLSHFHPESSYGIPNRTPRPKNFPAQIEQDHQQPALPGIWWPWQQIESSSQEFWADIPVSSPREFWAWTKKENRRLWTEPRRASWGGLKSQGPEQS